jgi:hypothetical protein
MSLQIVRFASVFFVALALAPALAHVLELPNKIGLSREEYVAVQRLYRGWQFVGVLVVGALLSTGLLAVMARDEPEHFVPALVAFGAVALTQVIFWLFTFPVNRGTANWTSVPAEWERLRKRWEYSHAMSAVCNLVALAAVIVAILPPLS